ncbi:MAG: DUF2804 family protein [Kofleriaceae bacterium]|nr:DUF2804 family protein [Kofleriaceae bacterium]MBP9169650.1 DUF2804 family protein [Kofleriaceae bacterium]MBP9859458.1 DUF2804 family protein [Kofleriaceae bacterium]
MSASAFAAPPARLVDDGRPHLGRFAGPIGHTNLLDARYRGWPRPLRWWRLKEWQALQVVTPRLFLNVALFDAKLITLVQLKLYDRARGEKHLIERTLRPRAFRLTDQLRASVTAYRDRATTLAFTNRLADGFLEVELASTTPAVTGQLRVDTAAGASQVVSLPLPRGSMYSHKGMFPVTGAITLGADRFDLDGGLALLDDHKGYYPYVMEWDWVTSAARGDDGVARGFNLTRNQCVEPERYNENCAWVGAAVGALPAVTFTRTDVGTAAERWQVRDRDGRVDLTFTPTVPGDVRLNLGVIESRYRGPFGTCAGRLAPAGLPEVAVDDWFGMGERFWLRC